VSYARRSRQVPGSAGLSALVIMLASTVVCVRVAAIIAAVNPGSLAVCAAPILALLLIMALLSAATWLLARKETVEMAPPGNPTELKSALAFTLIFAVVLFAVTAAKEYFGQRGLYLVAGLSGLTDMDAITLSTAQMAQAGRLAPDTVGNLVVIAYLANLVFKGLTVALLGSRPLLRWISVLFTLAFAGGLAVLSYW
jgi:uncharacterized membrane protein (DUF4010 family)